MRYVLMLVTAVGAFCLAGCKKFDCSEPPATGGNCNLAQSLVTYQINNPYTRTQYQKECDENGRAVKVTAGVFSHGLKFSHIFQLLYDSHAIYLMDEGTSDTALIALFDGAGRLQKIAQAHDALFNAFLPVQFTYGEKGLAHIQIIADRPEGTSLYTKYDTKGNIIELSDSTDQSFRGFAYTYDLSVTATKQFYSDDFYDSRYSAFYLAEFLGWLPDLQPVNKRTSSAMNGNEAIPLSNHVYDSEGRLVSYESGQDFSEYNLTFTNVWHCDSQKHKTVN